MPAVSALVRQALPGRVRIRERVPARTATTFAVGAGIELLLEPLSVEAAVELLELLKKHGVAWRVLGAGSNVLLPDTPLSMPVIRLGREFSAFWPLSGHGDQSTLAAVFSRAGEPFATEISSGRGPVRVAALAAAPLMGLSRRLSAAGLSGLEFASGIPGSVGGGVRMNAGAHGAELAEVFEGCLVVDASGSVSEVGPAAAG